MGGERQRELEMGAVGRHIEGHMVEELDDDGRPKRTGTVWTASAHIITAVIGSGVLSLAWAMAQLGWIAGPATLLIFSAITLYTSRFLADSYRTMDLTSGKRNYTYRTAVRSYLGGAQVWLCAISQYLNLFGVCIGYTITAAISAAAVRKSVCFHKHGHNADCSQPNSVYIVAFGIVQVFLSQLPNFHKLWWVSIFAAVMSFGYSCTGVGLALAKTISDRTGRTSITGVEVGVDVDSASKIWQSFEALGDIAFAYSFANVLIEIQDTVGSPPPENKVMKKASFIGVSTTTLFYMLCGCLGYAAFGNDAPGNMLTGFGFYEPYWLVGFANVCIVLHLIGAYQVFGQPLFAVAETWVARRWPDWKMATQELPLAPGCSVTVFRLVWRTCFVVITTLLAVLFPFFNSVLAFLGAAAFWPLTVYLPIQMHVTRKRIPKSTLKYVLLQTLSFLCFLVSLVAVVASIRGVAQSLKTYKPFHTKS